MVRLEGLIQDYEAELLEAASHKEVTLDNAELEVPRIKEARERLFQLAEQIDIAFAMRQLIQSNISRVEFESGLVNLRISISNLEKVMSSLRQLINLSGPRIRIHQDLDHAFQSFERLRNAGEGETIRAERSRLKQLVFKMPAVDPKDLVSVRDYLHSSHLSLDELNSNERDILSRTGFSLPVAENFISLFNKIGIPVYEVAPPQPEEQVEPLGITSEGQETETVAEGAQSEEALPHEEPMPAPEAPQPLKEVFVEDPYYVPKSITKEPIPIENLSSPSSKYPEPLGGYDVPVTAQPKPQEEAAP